MLQQKEYGGLSIVILVFSILTVSLSGCGGGSSTLANKFQGIWEQTGYGDAYKINKNGDGTVYQFTRATCLLADTLDTEELQEILSSAKLSADKNTIKVGESDGSAFITRLHRLQTLPDSCLNNRLITSPTPINTFEHVWHSFNDYYAFFNEREVDWNAQYAKFQPQVTENMDNESLFKLLASMLEPIDDAHITLTAGDDSYSPSKDPKAFLEISQAFLQQDEFDDIEDYLKSILIKYSTTIYSYLEAESIGILGGKLAKFGVIKNSTIGYLQINGMLGFIDGDTLDNVNAIRTLMKEVMTNLKYTQGMIIDVRLNGGGYDAVSLAIASYFTDQRRQVLSKKARYWLGETETVNAYIEPTGENTYLKPIIVIAGENSFSATEIFLMTMKALPQVTLIGENSGGATSDALEKALPNGWEVSLSNEVYFDSFGKNHEVTGVPADVDVSVFSVEAVNAGRDDAIETALQLLGQ